MRRTQKKRRSEVEVSIWDRLKKKKKRMQESDQDKHVRVERPRSQEVDMTDEGEAEEELEGFLGRACVGRSALEESSQTLDPPTDGSVAQERRRGKTVRLDEKRQDETGAEAIEAAADMFSGHEVIRSPCYVAEAHFEDVIRRELKTLRAYQTFMVNLAHHTRKVWADGLAKYEDSRYEDSRMVTREREVWLRERSQHYVDALHTPAEELTEEHSVRRRLYELFVMMRFEEHHMGQKDGEYNFSFVPERTTQRQVVQWFDAMDRREQDRLMGWLRAYMLQEGGIDSNAFVITDRSIEILIDNKERGKLGWMSVRRWNC